MNNEGKYKMRSIITLTIVVVFTQLTTSCSMKPEEKQTLSQVEADTREAIGIPDKVTNGFINEGAIKHVYSAEYWGIKNKSENFVPLSGGGSQPWQELMKHLAKAKTFEEYSACYTEDSKPALEKLKGKLENILKTDNVVPVKRQYYLS